MNVLENCAEAAPDPSIEATATAASEERNLRMTISNGFEPADSNATARRCRGQRGRAPRRCCFHATGDVDVIERLPLLQRTSRLLRLASIACAALFAPIALAQGAPQGGDDNGARVGRVATFQGEVFVAPQDKPDEWAAVSLNYPVGTGDNLWMSGDGHAEIDYGGGQLRLGGDSNVHLSRLDDRQFALFVAQGRVIVRVRTLEPGETAVIDTPNAQIDLERPGLYRIDVSPDPAQTWVLVREGEAGIGLPGGAQQVLPGQTATVTGAGNAVAEVQNGVTVDALDTWSADRDRVYEGGRRAASYVSPEMVGYSDLDANGQWSTYPEYGAVWFPSTVVADWAPYRYGHWVWLAAYGWTWVDNAPWGYAPFHYGRWAYIGGRWGWCPGTFVRRPVWAPALVAWYGGNGWSVSASAGAPVYGWVPLGWRDPFVPWWGRCGSRCYERYNRPYAVNVAERSNRPPTYYANHSVPGAITAVPGAAFRGAQPVAVNRVALSPQAFASAPRLAGAPQVKPLAISTNVVRVGNGAPLPAGQIAARVKPAAVAPVTRQVGAAPGRNPVVQGPGTRAVGPAQQPVTRAPGAPYTPQPSYEARPGREVTPNAPPGAVRPAPMAVPPSTVTRSNPPVNAAPAQRFTPPVTSTPSATSAPPAQSRGVQREVVQHPVEKPAMRAPQAPVSSAPPRPAPAPVAPSPVRPPERAAPERPAAGQGHPQEAKPSPKPGERDR
jgi:hypothetical protein